MLGELAKLIPSSVSAESGKAFYSGRLAFSRPSPIYILGMNPGRDRTRADSTVAAHTQAVLTTKAADWSEYRDESWRGGEPGTAGMQPRVLHLLETLELSPGKVPCSNLIFVRSRRTSNLSDVDTLADQCWPLHQRVIELLRPKVILCFGTVAGSYVQKRLTAYQLCDELVEKNERRWKSVVFSGTGGIKVIIATHPSVADWRARATDPSSLVRVALER